MEPHDVTQLRGPSDSATWLDELGRRLPRHAETLRRLSRGARGDARIVQFSVSCSVARGEGDELSDLDCELSLEPDAWPSGLELVEPLVRSAGDVIELLHHRWPASGATEHRRTAVQYANGVQLDLMVWPVTVWSGMHPPDAVVLHSTRDVFTRPWDRARSVPTLDRLHEWCCLGWWALLDADKYLRRGSLWEAAQRLEDARTAVWQLTAAAQRLPFPEYGITSLLDAAEPRLPGRVEGTVAVLEVNALRTAVDLCAELLDAAWAPAATAVGAPPEVVSPPLSRWSLQRLATARRGRPDLDLPGVHPASNIQEHELVYEVENRGADPNGRLEAAMWAIEPWEDRVVLDLGAGTGFHLPRFAASARHVLGVEPHGPSRRAAMERCARLGLTNVSVLTGSAERLLLDASSVDIIHARFAYFFGPGCEPGLAEVERVLKPGGVAFIIDNDRHHGGFATWLARSPWAPSGSPETVEHFWLSQGFQILRVPSEWRFESRDDLEAVVRIEFPMELAEELLREQAGTSIEYHYAVYWRRYGGRLEQVPNRRPAPF